MKAIDIATRNHISIDDMMEVCKELEIPCADGVSELSQKEVFLIEKKIEAIKNRKLKLAEQDKKGKKIKLKRKVQIHKEPVKGKPGEAAAPEGEVKTEETVVTAPQQPAPRENRETVAAQNPHQNRDSRDTRDTRRPMGPRPEGGTGRPEGSGPRPTGTRPDSRPGSGTRPEGGGYRGNRPAGAPYGGQGQGSRGPGQRPQGQGYQGYRPGQNRPDRVVAGMPIKDLTKPGVTPVAAETGDTKDKAAKRKSATKAKEKQKAFTKKTKEKEKEKNFSFSRKKPVEQKKKEAVAPSEINITENISVGDLSKKLNVKANDVIARLMKLGVMATINQIIDSDTAQILASEYGTEVKVVSLFDETVIRHEEEVDKSEDHMERPPVVTVMGHVDHGKTKLLDAIRKTDVVAGEHGGITQHIGAYQVNVHGKKVTFLDTPGHAAFTTMRARGAKITDIVVLVVAANDGVMPQTVEAINHAKDAGVPIVVAINKIDLPDANIKKVRETLAGYELVPEEWGGSTLFAEISAKQGINIDGLLELILIQAEMLELNANPKLVARGTVIESRLDPGRGPVSTILIQNGTLHAGDAFVVGVYAGKVRAMFDDQGKPLEAALPATPVEVLGIAGVPSAGDPFEGMDSERSARGISQKRLEFKRLESARKVRKVTLESLNEMIKEGEVQEIRIIVKADVDGSAQALTESLEKLSTGEVRVKVIHVGTGGINDSDVMLASASNAIIIGYHVRPTGKVSDLADKENVDIKYFNIIFEATDSIKAAMLGMLSPDIKEVPGGQGEIRQVFKVSKIGTIAGSVVLSGKIRRDQKMRLIREGVVVYDGVIKSLKRYKDDVSEVDGGQEFGFGLDGFNDIKEGDTFETYSLIEVAKTLG